MHARISQTHQVERHTLLRNLLGALVFLGAGAFLSGCLDEKETVLRVGLLPDQSEEELRQRFKPLFDHVSNKAGVRYKFFVPSSYQELVDKFEAAELDIAYFGGFTFVKSEKSVNALPLVMRDVDRKFKSVLLVAANNPAKSIEDLKGSTFSFGSRLSTSGHLMPRFFLEEKGIEPDSFFSTVLYSGAHDKTALAVQDSIADAGVLNGEIASRMFAQGALDPARVRILWETPPYSDYVWVIRKSVNAEVRNKLLQGFLMLSQDDPNHREILKRVGAKSFLPARADNFAGVRRIAQSLNLL